MNSLNIRFLCFLFVGLILSACKKELNVFPTTSEVDGNVIVDSKSATTVLNGVYYRFASGSSDNNQLPISSWSDLNEAFPSCLCNSLNNTSQTWSALNFNADPSVSFGVDFQWNYGYNIVNAANGFLKNIAPLATISADVKKRMIAEARFLRAFGNAQLLLYYGQFNDVNSKYGIILRTQFVTKNDLNLPRATVAESYNAIIGDLDTAIIDLPKLNSQIVYANVSAAKLLKARVLINRGAVGDYAEVIRLTTDIISDRTFILEDNVKDVFLVKGFSSREVIMGIQPFPNQILKYNNNQFYVQYPVTDAFIGLLNNDPRNQWVYQSITIPRPEQTFTKYFSGDGNNISQTSLSEYSYAFRLTEAYLLEAEAIVLSGGSLNDARELLKVVMAHAGITQAAYPAQYAAVDNANAETLKLLIIKETLKNFVGESGVDWFALRRLPLETIQTIQPSLTTKDQMILPIPKTEMDQNPFLSGMQNPGYGK